MAKAELLKPFILRWEGGFVDDPLDRGGATNKGITIGTFRSFYGQGATVEQLKNITDEQWLHIFKSGYWDKWKADNIANQSIANTLCGLGLGFGNRNIYQTGTENSRCGRGRHCRQRHPYRNQHSRPKGTV